MLDRLSIRGRVTAGMMAVLGLILASLLPLALAHLSHTITEAEERQLAGYHRSLMADIALRGLAAAELAIIVANIEEVQERFAIGDRAGLQARLSAPFSALLKDGGVDQFQFHTPDGRSFLRLHMPATFGDDLSTFRHTLAAANQSLSRVTGIERGVADLGIRSVLPVFYGGRHVGSVEFGMDLAESFVKRFKASYEIDLAISVPENGGFRSRATTFEPLAVSPPLARALAGEMIFDTVTGEKMRKARLTAPLADFSGKNVAVVELVMDASPFAAALTEAHMLAAAGAVGALGLGFLAAWWIARGLVKPLDGVSQALWRLAEADIPAEIPGTRRMDEIGRIAQAVEVFRRQSIENRELHGKESELVALVRGSSDAIVGQNNEGIITSWNTGARRIYGWVAGEMVGRPFTALMPGGESDWCRLLAAVAAGTAVEQHEMKHLTKEGARIPVSLTLSPIRGQDQQIDGVSAIVRDISSQKTAEAAFRKLYQAMRALSAGNQALVQAKSEDGLLAAMCAAIVDIAGYQSAWVAGIDGGDVRHPHMVAGKVRGGGKPLAVRCLTLATGSCPATEAMRTGRPVVVHHIDVTCPYPGCLKGAKRHGSSSLLALPLFNRDQVAFGALTIHADDPSSFHDEETALLREMAGDLAFGIDHLRDRSERHRANAQLERVLESTIQAVAATVEVRDPYTAGHQRRVSDFAVAVAREMGLAEDRVKGILVAGLVHDIGKISVPIELLNRPGKLTAIEFEMIKLHASVGHDILKGIEFPWPVVQAVLQHHERIDGSGYPQGLSGNAVIMEARVLAVADVVDAIASHRPYRPALGVEVAIDELENGVGRLYDADVTRAMLGLLQSKRLIVT